MKRSGIATSKRLTKPLPVSKRTYQTQASVEKQRYVYPEGPYSSIKATQELIRRPTPWHSSV